MKYTYYAVVDTDEIIKHFKCKLDDFPHIKNCKKVYKFSTDSEIETSYFDNKIKYYEYFCQIILQTLRAFCIEMTHNAIHNESESLTEHEELLINDLEPLINEINKKQTFLADKLCRDYYSHYLFRCVYPAVKSFDNSLVKFFGTIS